MGVRMGKCIMKSGEAYYDFQTRAFMARSRCSLATYLTSSTKFKQIRIVRECHICRSCQAPSSYIDVCLDVVDQTLHTHVVVLWPYKTEDDQVHVRIVEFFCEVMHDMDFHASHRVLVVGVPAYAHDHGVHGSPVRTSWLVGCSIRTVAALI